MLVNTKKAIKPMLELDPTISPEQIAAAIEALEGKSKPTIVSAAPISRNLSREQVAEIFGKSVKTIDLWGRRGILERVMIAGSSRAAGYSEESVRKVLERSRSVPSK